MQTAYRPDAQTAGMHSPASTATRWPDWLSRSASASSRYWAGASLDSDFGSDVQRQVPARRRDNLECPFGVRLPVTGGDCCNHGDHSGDGVRGVRRVAPMMTRPASQG